MLKENAANDVISLALSQLLFKNLRDKLLLFLLNLNSQERKKGRLCNFVFYDKVFSGLF